MRLLDDDDLTRVTGGDDAGDGGACASLGADMAGIAWGMVTDNPAQVGINTAAAIADGAACFGGSSSSDGDSGGVCGANSGYGGYGGAGSGCGDGGDGGDGGGGGGGD